MKRLKCVPHHLVHYIPKANLERFLQLKNQIDALSFPCVHNELALHWLSAKVRRRRCDMEATSLRNARLEALHIPARELCIVISNHERNE